MSRHDRTRLSMRELIAEAERREIAGAEWMDRATLLRALDETDADAALSPLARARRFLGQVTGLGRVVKVVRGAIDPARPEPPSLVTSERAHVDVAPPAPISAGVPGEPGRRNCVGSALRTTPPEIASPVIEEDVAPIDAPIETAAESTLEVPPPASELLAGDPSFGGLRVVNRGGRGWLVWRAPGARLAAIGRGTDLTLRMVSIGCAIGEPNAEVVVETADEIGLALEGVRALPESRGRQCVAAIGVGRGDGFVAVAHARVA